MEHAIDDLYDKTDMALLAKGGRDAIACFIQLSRKVYEASGDRGLRSFIKEVLPLIPEDGRAEIIVILFTTLLDEKKSRGKQVQPPSRTIH